MISSFPVRGKIRWRRRRDSNPYSVTPRFKTRNQETQSFSHRTIAGYCRQSPSNAVDLFRKCSANHKEEIQNEAESCFLPFPNRTQKVTASLAVLLVELQTIKSQKFHNLEIPNASAKPATPHTLRTIVDHQCVGGPRFVSTSEKREKDKNK